MVGGDRDPFCHGTRRSPCLGRLEKVYIGQPTRQFWQEICGRSKWSQYELRSTTIRGGTCSARRRSGGPTKRGHSRTTRQVRHAPSSCHRAAFEPRHDVLSLISFFELHTVIHPRQVTEFIYRYNAPDRAHVFLSFQLESSSRAKEVANVLDELERGGMNGHDISDDELAKSHARYLIGGASDVPNERIFRFGTIHSPFGCRLPLLINLFLLNTTSCAQCTCTCTTHMHHAPITRNRVSRAPWCPAQIPYLPSRYWMEYLTVPLPEPWRRCATFPHTLSQ